MPMKYMTVLEASQKWGISDRRVRFLCSQGRIRGIIQQGRRYLIPDNAEKPSDERVKKSKKNNARHYNDFTRLDFLKGMASEAPELSRTATEEMNRKFLEKFTFDCNALEGNTLSEEEVKQVLAGQVVEGHPLAEHMAVIGVRDGFDYARDCVLEKKPLSQNTIKNIHSLVLMDQPNAKGKYRRVRVRIKQAESSPVYLDLMEPRVNDLLNLNTQRKKVMHPIERIARFHLEFQGIHPFEDGNGRTGRILMNLELMQSGYPPVSIEPADEPAYSNAFKEYYQDHRAEAMTKLLSEKLEAALEKQLNASRKKKSKRSAPAENAEAKPVA